MLGSLMPFSDLPVQPVFTPWRMLGRVLKWSGIAALGLTAFVCALLAAAFLINADDEPLSLQARALLSPPPNPYRPEDNIYLAFQGLDAPAGTSVITAGAARIERYNRSIEAVMQDPSAASVRRLNATDPRGLQLTGDVSFVQPLNASVWQAATRHQPEIRKLLADNRELYQRYLDLLPLPGYYETARPSMYAPYSFLPSQVHKLFLAAIALHVRSQFAHERARALADLELDARLWRTVFNGEGGLVSKMVAAASLQADDLLLADMIADPEVALPLTEEDLNALVPAFDPASWDLGGAFAAEFRVSSSLLRQTAQLAAGAVAREGPAQSGLRGWLRRLNSRIEAHFFKLNATENLFARQTARRMLIARDPTRPKTTNSELPASLSEARAWPVRLCYNPVGRILAAIADPPYDNYPLRVWDVAALQRLVRLGYEIRRERIGPIAVPSFLEQHPDWSTHPADGRPFLWDSVKGELRVQTVARQQPGRRFAVPVWKPSAPPSLAPPDDPR